MHKTGEGIMYKQINRWIISTFMVLTSYLCATPIASAQATAAAPATATTVPQSEALKISITPSGNYQNASIQMPAGIDGQTLSVALNGKDITSRFTQSPCGANVCENGALSEADGLLAGKNVIYASIKSKDSRVISSRERFNNGAVRQTAAESRVGAPGSAVRPMSVGSSQFPTTSNFLPPSVAFQTLQAGGAAPGQPWIQIGSQLVISVPGTCSIYVVAVLDRSQLTLTSTQCFGNGESLYAYLNTLGSNDLVIVGTTAGNITDSQLGSDQFITLPIGGVVYNCPPPNCSAAAQSQYTPNSYIGIGAGGADPGSAFEAFNDPSDATQTPPQIFGTLVEDPQGYYNYQTSGTVEFWTGASSAANGAASEVKMSQMAGQFANWPVWITPPSFSGVGGYWLFKLDRTSLNPAGSFSSNFVNGEGWFLSNVGNFYPTGSTNATTATNAFANLANDLNSTARDQLLFLLTVGNPNGSTRSAEDTAQLNYTDSNGTQHFAYYNTFGPALLRLGVNPGPTMFLYNNTDAFAMVSCLQCGEPIAGNTALSTTTNANQGQTGLMHGLLQTNLSGLYWPTRVSQVTSSADDTIDYSMEYIVSQPPVDWPELSSPLSPAVSSLAAQQAAYHYLSYQLITNYYIFGASGNYLDDIHYYFTGSNVTALDYHVMNPANLPFPGASGGSYTWTDPVTNTQLTPFTAADQAAVAVQLRVELVYLYNVLQYMVNGTPNMKDIVASGNGSAAFALIDAAETVQGSTLQPPPNTPASLNVSKILSFTGNVVNLAATVATAGIVPPNLVGAVKTVSGGISAILGGAGNYMAGFTNPGHTYLPSPQYKAATTVAALSDQALQGAFAVGFDTQLDSLLSDWGKMSLLGPRITDTNNAAYYSPNQAAQNVAVQLIRQATQQQYFLALLPTTYKIQYYPSWYTLVPNACSTGGESWYANPAPTNVYVAFPTYNGVPIPYNPQQANPISQPWDLYVMAGPTQNAGKSNQLFPYPDSQLATQLFNTGSGNLNLPMNDVFSQVGPLSSVVLNVTTNNFTGTSLYYLNVCTKAPNSQATTTSIVVPSQAGQSDSITLQAKVTGANAVPIGTVSFQEGANVIASASIDSGGNANITVAPMVVGNHSITGYFIPLDSTRDTASQSQSSTLVVKAIVPDMSLSLSSSSVTVPYETPSSPISLTVTSLGGMSGQLSFVCAGLPLGMSCNFSPAQASLASAGTASTSFTISQPTSTAAGLAVWGGPGFLLILISAITALRVSRGRRALVGVTWALVLFSLSTVMLSGCASNSSGSNTNSRQTGTTNILVTVTGGTTTKTIPLSVNVQ
jgi:hypothetical protein